MRTIVFDTNVLLADPNVLLAFPDAMIIIPETVLGELDKLKTSRVDPDLRFRGREVSRLLFELSEQGSLIDGIPLPDGGTLRVVPLDSDAPVPEGLSGRNADDRILAVAVNACQAGCEGLTLITNDLNMLLKAQTLGVEVERHGDGTEGGLAKRYIIRPFQRYRVPLSILAISLAVFAAVLLLAVYGSRLVSSPGTAGVPEEFLQLLTTEQRAVLEDLQTLSSNPRDTQALLDMANYYFGLRERTGDARWGRQAVQYYESYLAIMPDDVNARTDMAIQYYLIGQTDRAIQEVTRGLEAEAQHVNGNFNLGIFYWQGRKDYPGAEAQFLKVIELTSASPDSPEHSIRQQAVGALEQLRVEAEAAGVPLSEESTLEGTF
ncbi:MAG: PIN domain-containing protein [Coriobacteriia bacterium]|nr:PIN domain-containing protein [Coriobacteriia bacterium]